MARNDNHLLQSHESKELLGEQADPPQDSLRMSLKNGKKPSMLVEQGIRSGNKERLDSGTKGNTANYPAFIEYKTFGEIVELSYL